MSTVSRAFLEGGLGWLTFFPFNVRHAIVFLMTAATLSWGQAATPIRIDAREAFREPGPARYDIEWNKSPAGRTIGLNSRYLTLDGKPWLPVMGEFHFTRYSPAQWEEEILKMKSAGVNIVATYVVWIHHEEIEGEWEWSGQRDLRRFVELCARHGMQVFVRVGPWAHGEVRNGGFPDWLAAKCATRVNDPVYLAQVKEWYGQIGRQLDGLMWKDGGPVIGAQLENEYAKRGPGAGEAHILELKRLAVAGGLKVPLFTVTAWDNAVVPERAVMPIYGGGYPDAPWDSSLGKLPPAEVYAFRFRSRVTANMSAQGKQDDSAALPVPYLTAEIGGGVEDTYHRRPVIEADDIAAMYPVMLGSGVNLYGTYMFQGGENPEAKSGTLQESQATGYPTDVPQKSYDFQAPLSEFGEERASFRKMKVFQYFVNDFGSELAPMAVHPPERLPASPADLSVVRASVRSQGDAGFLFVDNYVRGAEMPARKAAQAEIRLAEGMLRLPRRPVDIPSGAYFIWPFNLRVAGVTIRYATAQLFTRMEADGRTTLYFEALPGIAPEFAIDAASARVASISQGRTEREGKVVYVSGVEPGVDSMIDLLSSGGDSVRIVVLTQAEAENAWKARLGGGEHLLVAAPESEGMEFFADSSAQRVYLRSAGKPEFDFNILPPLAAAPQASLALEPLRVSQRASGFAARAKALSSTVTPEPVQPAGTAAPVKLGPAPATRDHGVAEAPAEEEFQHAAKWRIALPEGAMQGLSDLVLQVKYQGDVARFWANDRLVTDNFYNGQPWRIGLKGFLDKDRGGKFQLEILPLRQDAPIYLETPELPNFESSGQVDRLEEVRLVPQYELILGEAGHELSLKHADTPSPR